jgi:excisionase family DNA binding protein
MITTKEMARMLGVTPGRVIQLITDRVIEGEKYGRDYLIPISEIPKAKKRKIARGPARGKKYKKK